MINISKDVLIKAFLAALFSSITIGALSLLTYKTSFGLFLMASFGPQWFYYMDFLKVHLPSQKIFFFGHLLTFFVGIMFLQYMPLPIFINIPFAVGVGVFLMIIFNVTHPPAGGNPIIVIIGGVSFEYLINPVIFGCLIILFFGIVLNKFILKKKYPLK